MDGKIFVVEEVDPETGLSAYFVEAYQDHANVVVIGTGLVVPVIRSGLDENREI